MSGPGAAEPTVGTVNSVQLSKVGRKNIYFPSHFWWPDVPKMHQTAQICTYIFKKNFLGVIPPHASTLGGIKPLPHTRTPPRAPTVPLFQSFCGRWSGPQDFHTNELNNLYDAVCIFNLLFMITGIVMFHSVIFPLYLHVLAFFLYG